MRNLFNANFPRAYLLVKWATLLLCLTAIPVVAQTDFRPGYVVKNDNDTIKGFVAYRGDKKNSKSCLFREKTKRDQVSFGPGDIKGFGIDGLKSYESIELPSDAPGQGKVFARKLSEGYADLFRYGKIFLLKRPSGVITIPSPKTERYGDPADMVAKESKRYIGILNTVLIDCNMQAIDVSYTESDISRVIDRYNQCKKDFKPRIQPPNFKVNWSIYAGYLSSSLKFDYFKSIPFESTSITGGIGAEFSSPRVFDRLFFDVELWYVKGFYQGYYEEDKFGAHYKYDVMADIQALTIPVGFRYNISSSRSTPYLKGGISFSPVINTEVMTLEDRITVEDEVFTRELTDNFEIKNPMGFWLGAGYNRLIGRQQVFLEFRYERAQGYLGSALVNYSQSNNYTFSFGIRF